MAAKVFSLGLEKILDGTIALESDDIRCMLVDQGYSAAIDDTDEFVLALDAYQVNATGAVEDFGGTNRKPLVSEAVDDGSDLVKFDAADLVWDPIGGALNDTVGGVLIYKHDTSDAASPVICYMDLDSNKVTDGGSLTIQFAAEGLFQITTTET